MRWIAHFLSCNRSRHAYDPALLDQSLFEGLRDVKFVGGVITPVPIANQIRT